MTTEAVQGSSNSGSFYETPLQADGDTGKSGLLVRVILSGEQATEIAAGKGLRLWLHEGGQC